MKIVAEFCTPMPFTSDEMEVGVLYTTVQAMYEETGDGSRTKFVHNEPYKYAEAEQFPPQFRSGQYSYKIHMIGDGDIAGQMFKSYEDDPKQFKSEKTGLGPLGDDWMSKTDHITNNYTLIVIDLSVSKFLIPGRFKKFVIRTATKTPWKYYTQIFCTTDEWINLTMEDIRKLEKQCADGGSQPR